MINLKFVPILDQPFLLPYFVHPTRMFRNRRQGTKQKRKLGSTLGRMTKPYHSEAMDC